MPLRPLLVVALGTSLVAGALVSPARAYVPAGTTWTSATIHESDGTALEAEVFRPGGLTPGERTPVVLEVSPYMSNAVDSGHPLGWHRPAFLGWDLEQAGLFRRGYTYVEVALRGYGGSTGCTDLGGPGEQRDVVAAVEWSASQSWSTGRVGMWGMSYDGWTQVMALANHPRGLAAVVMQAPVVHPLWAVASNRVRYADVLGYGAAEDYLALNNEPPGPYAVADPPDTGYDSAALVPDASCLAPDVLGTASTDPQSAFWRARDLTARVQGSRVPALLGFGFLDQTVHPTQLLPLWQALRGPKELYVGQWDHVVVDPAEEPADSGTDPDSIGRDAFMAQALRWFDRYVKGMPGGSRDPVVTVEEGHGSWRAETAWPVPGRAVTVPLRAGTYRDVPGNDAEARGGSPYPGVQTPAEPTGTGLWTVGRSLSSDALLSGVARLRASIDVAVAGAHLVGLLYDVAPDGRATLVTRGATVLPASGTVSLALWPQQWRVQAGHRIAVLLTAGDDSVFTPGSTGLSVTVQSASLTLPCAPVDTGVPLAGRPSSAVGAHAPIQVPAGGASPWEACR